MISTERIQDAGEYVEWLRVKVHEKSLPANNRVRVAGSCFGIAQTHHHSIVLLIEHGLYASAFALLRSGFEAYVRGQWLARCAVESQIEEYLKGKDLKQIFGLILDVEKTVGFEEKVLSDIKSKAWKTLCEYTHTGGLHIQRWNTSDSIEPNYKKEEILEVIDLAEFVGVMSIFGIVELANDEDLAMQILENIKQRVAARGKT